MPMATLDPLHPLASAITEILSERSGLTMTMLRELLNTKHKLRPSIQNLYRTVGLLIDAQVLVKTKGKLGLNLVWVSHLRRLSDTVTDTYLSTDNALIELPTRQGERKEYSADSLAGLDPVWNHLLTAVTDQPTDTDLYEYNSHPYFYISAPAMETRLYTNIIQRSIRRHLLHGKTTFLDRYGDRLASLDGLHTLCTDATPFPQEGYILQVYGDYVIECVLPASISDQFAHFFRTVT